MTDLPISRRRAETRHRLMEAALQVFGERGVLAASVEEICERASFTRGAFYSNFESKNALVLAMLREEADQSNAFVSQVKTSGAVDRATAEPALLYDLAAAAIRSTVVGSIGDRGKVMAVVEMRLYAAREPSIRAAYLEFRRANKEELLDQLLQLAQASGWEFALPEYSAIEVMDAMYERTTLKAAMVDPDGSHPELLDEVIQPYVDVMACIMRPVGAAAGHDAEGADDVA